jgi:hypothetical protein
MSALVVSAFWPQAAMASVDANSSKALNFIMSLLRSLQRAGR